MIGILATNPYAVLTMASVRPIHPPESWVVFSRGPLDVGVNAYLRDGAASPLFVQVGDLKPATLHAAMQRTDAKAAGIFPLLRAGTLLLKDLAEPLRRSRRWEKGWVMGYASRLMYADRARMAAAYRAIGENTQRNQAGGLAVFHPAAAWDSTKTFPLPPHYCWSHDPLVENYFSTTQAIKHGWYGQEAWTLDYIGMVTDPRLALSICHAAPLELYRTAAETVADYLPRRALDVIRRNGERAAFVKNIRHLTAPLAAYYDRPEL